MRLICPNCSAQYEVPTEVIPQGGRDVQCSSCGHTWFQNHPDDDPVLAEELNQPVPDTQWRPDAHDEDDAGPDTPDDAAPDEESDPSPAADVPADAPRRRSLDPSVADVLRAEAERESRVRASESGGLESQPDLGLEEPDEDEAARRAREARERMARMRGAPAEPPHAAAAAAAAASSRRELLPNVDEINQTLRSSSERRAVETPQGRAPLDEPPSGFGRGFTTVLIIAILATTLYLFAPRLAGMVPAAEPVLGSYVGAVDAARLWLDGQVTALLTALDSMSSEQGEAPDAN